MLKIEVEGCDGAGKSTALKYLINKLQEMEMQVVETREVGSPLVPINVELRKLVLNPDSNLSGEAMELIFAAMRIENERKYKEIDTDFIVSDRGWFSHLAYTDHNVSTEFTERLYNNFLADITTLPDIVVYLNVSEETALARRTRRGEEADVIELKGVPFQQKVRESFEKYISEYKSSSNINFFEIDANQDLENVKSQLDSIAAQLVSIKLGGLHASTGKKKLDQNATDSL